MDDPRDKTLHNNAKARYRNSSIFGNIMYSFYKNAWVGIEYDRMSTDYRDYRDRVDHRIQVSFILKF